MVSSNKLVWPYRPRRIASFPLCPFVSFEVNCEFKKQSSRELHERLNHQ
jgi:hypothetical protein